MENKIDPNTGLLARDDHEQKIIGYENFTRFDILCGHSFIKEFYCPIEEVITIDGEYHEIS